MEKKQETKKGFEKIEKKFYIILIIFFSILSLCYYLYLSNLGSENWGVLSVSIFVISFFSALFLFLFYMLYKSKESKILRHIIWLFGRIFSPLILLIVIYKQNSIDITDIFFTILIIIYYEFEFKALKKSFKNHMDKKREMEKKKKSPTKEKKVNGGYKKINDGLTTLRNLR